MRLFRLHCVTSLTSDMVFVSPQRNGSSVGILSGWNKLILHLVSLELSHSPRCVCHQPAAQQTTLLIKVQIASVDIRLPFSPLPPLMRVCGAVVYPATLSFQSPSNPLGLGLLSSASFYGKRGMFSDRLFPPIPFSGSGNMRGHV